MSAWQADIGGVNMDMSAHLTSLAPQYRFTACLLYCLSANAEPCRYLPIFDLS